MHEDTGCLFHIYDEVGCLKVSIQVRTLKNKHLWTTGSEMFFYPEEKEMLLSPNAQ